MVTADCTTTTLAGTTPGVLDVASVALTPFNPDQTSSDRVSSLTLEFPAIPKETYRTTGTHPCAPGPFDSTLSIWHEGFRVFHPQFNFPGADFAPGEPPVFATAVYPDREIGAGGGGFRENGKIELVHTPRPAVAVPPPRVLPEESGDFVPGSQDGSPA
jgi:hypothetical protein